MINLRSFLCCVSIIFLSSLPGRAAEAGGPDPILQNELKQQQIRAVTDKVVTQLGEITAEFERNGLAGRDVDNLNQIQTVLGNLSRREMERVITLLQQARTDEPSSGQHIADAFSGQKGIIIQLQQLIDEYRRQQALHEISIRLKELADKQAVNMRLGVWLARNTEGKPLPAFDESQKLNLRLQETEQNTLKDEVGRQIAKLQAIAKETTDGAAAARVQAGLGRVKTGTVVGILESASADLNGGKLLSAAGNEKRSRDELREIARLLVHSEDPAETLRQALRDLDRAVEQQKEVMVETQNIDKKDEGMLVEAMQAEVVDQADLVRDDVQALAPAAAEYLRSATDRMQEARASLSERNSKAQRENAPPKQEQALVNLDQARQALETQLIKAEQMRTPPAEGVAELKDLLEEVRVLVQNQEALKTRTAAAAQEDLAAQAADQGSLKDKTQELQERAGHRSPTAAQSLSEAAAQMHKSQTSLANKQNNSSAQQAAVDALQKAEQQLRADLAQAEQHREELDRLTDLAHRLGEVIQRQEGIEFATGQAAAKSSNPPVEELAQQQQNLGEQVGQLEQEAAATVPEAAAHLGEAKLEMAAAKTELDKSAPKTAQPRQADALKKLYAAKAALERRVAELQSMLGLEEKPDLQDATALIEKAQENVSAAMAQMQQAPPGLMESLREQQQQIARGLTELSDGKSAPLTEAQRAATQAAQHLGENQLPKAVQAMQAAQHAMQSGQEEGAAPPAPIGTPKPESLAGLAEHQARVEKLASSLLQAQKGASGPALQQAAQQLGQASKTISPLTSGEKGSLPSSAQAALQSAQASLSMGAAQASGGKGAEAQSRATAAGDALAQAKAALALAQAGLGSEAAMAQSQGQGKGQGQGQGEGQGQGQGKGKGQGKGEGEGQGQPGPQGSGRKGNWTGTGSGEAGGGNVAGASAFTSLPPRDRAAIRQSQAEKYPQEYGPLVEQYLKNLSDQSTK